MPGLEKHTTIMIRLSSLCILVCTSCLLTASALGTESDLCEDGHYFSLIDHRCRTCSLCPRNQVIKIPCMKYSDQKCSPFRFNDYISAAESPGSSKIDEFYEEDIYYTVNADRKKATRVESKGNQRAEHLGSHTTMEKEDREYWKTLAFALIGLLSVLIVVATVFVLLACRKLQTVAVIKQPDEGEMDDADSGYVVIRSIRIAADPNPTKTDLSYYTRDEYDVHPPLLASLDTDLQPAFNLAAHTHPTSLCFLPKVYKPQRRLLNYDADDVFESDDSGSSWPVPGKSKLQPHSEKLIPLDFKLDVDNMESKQ